MIALFNPCLPHLFLFASVNVQSYGMLINDQNTERDAEFAAGDNTLPFLRPHYVPGTYCSSTLQISLALT